jgi:hypothetical protein
MEQLINDVKQLPSSHAFPPLPAYTHSAQAPTDPDEQRRILFYRSDWTARVAAYKAQRQAAKGSTEAKSTKATDANDDSSNNSDDDSDEELATPPSNQTHGPHPFIPKEEWHATYGFLVHRTTGKWIGARDLEVALSITRSSLITMVRCGKIINSSFTNGTGVDTKAWLCNVLEAHLPDFFIECHSHWKALLTIQRVASNFLSNYIASTAAPSGAVTPAVLLSAAHGPVPAPAVAEQLANVAPSVRSKTPASKTPATTTPNSPAGVVPAKRPRTSKDDNGKKTRKPQVVTTTL